MTERVESKQIEINCISKELSDNGLSRRGLLNRLKAVGVGFGAAFLLGIKESDAHGAPDATVKVKSTNPALNNIIEGAGPAGRSAPDNDPELKVAYYRWYHRHHYHRWYRRW